MTIKTRKLFAAASCSVALLGAAACGSSSDDSGTASDSSSSDSSSSSSDSASADPAANLVGPGCADYAKQVPNGAGSVDGMAQDPVATAASNNPLLKTLVQAVSGKINPDVNLVNDLNSGQLTVFAPVDSAFAKLPKATVADLAKPANAKMLTTILTTHVVQGQLAPSDVDGEQSTLAGNKITVKGSDDNITVNGAKVICGGVQTANATVYLIDSVLNPAGGHF
ncbi:cell surface glycolipoprotein MPT83 [Marmoricola endophyticus]|uniref:Cell surface glycolipoprotein MPT83 n=1 Tax=Marmoricola endophyticus TaxID=2040280 RepID=A0A917B961_9ACTN|nr:fasciclin domain-containing protein [Marmoricola endophyticus]GGF32386.1 cell surface glycolipoprotein MPT83 [Marmoricola endophyticus]